MTDESRALLTDVHTWYDGDTVSGQNPSTVNYARLTYLLIEIGTSSMQQYVLSRLPTPLIDLLNYPKIHDTFRKLTKTRAITAAQYHVLYPIDSTVVCTSKIDMSLWVILARNLVPNCDQIQWNKTPAEEDQLPEYHIIRYEI